MDNEINIRTLKRCDPTVDNILSAATQVAVYNYVGNDWNKLEIEGALFVVSKKGTNNFGLIIINRLNTNNFNEIIDRQWEVTLNLPFLLYKNDKGIIRCVWFYDQQDAKRVYDKLREITRNETKNGLDQTKLNIGGNGFSTIKPVEETLAKLGIKQQTITDDDGEQFFRSLIQQTTNQKMNNDSQAELNKGIQTPNVLNDKQQIPNLPATPGTLTRTLNLQELFSSSTSKPNVVSNLTNSFMEKFVDERCINEEDRTPIKTKIDSIKDDGDFVLTPAILKSNGIGNTKIGLEERQLSPPILSSTINPEQIYRPTPTQLNSNHDYLSPFQAKSTFASNQPPNPLTMEQLKQTLIYLLQNDADFLHTIHTSYSEKIQKRFN